jgi:hypothetical protein
MAIRALARSFLPSKARRQAGLLLFQPLGRYQIKAANSAYY